MPDSEAHYKKINQIISDYDKEIKNQNPSEEQLNSWRSTKSKLQRNIQEIIASNQAPYASKKISLPVILIATPEIVYLPANMGSLANVITTGDGGGLADISAALVAELDRQGVNVHVTLPEYQNLFKELAHITNREYHLLRGSMSDEGRIYPITDDIFKIAQRVYDDGSSYLDKINLRRATAFMRGIISRLLPELKARYKRVLVHCNDWMTGLVPAAATNMNIKSLITFHNIFTMHQQPSGLRKHSIDIRPYYKHLIFDEHPGSSFRFYKSMVKANEYIDFMTSGLYAADFINTVSLTFLKEMVAGYFTEHNIMSEYMRDTIVRRNGEQCATGILNAPASAMDPRKDQHLVKRYWYKTDGADGILDLQNGKELNKIAFQQRLGLPVIPDAPILFWPSRIATPQKGFELLLEIIPDLMKTYHKEKLQIAIVANGDAELIAKIKIYQEQYPNSICYMPFNRELSQLGMGGSDFVLMPSLYEPCGTPQVVGQLYGTPPIVRKTGGLADTVKHLSENGIDGSGFVFEDFLPSGLLFAVSEAMKFYKKPLDFRLGVLKRMMKECTVKFNIRETAKHYIEVYEEIFARNGHPVKVK